MPEGASLRGAAATSIRTRQTCGAGVAAAMGAAALLACAVVLSGIALRHGTALDELNPFGSVDDQTLPDQLGQPPVLSAMLHTEYPPGFNSDGQPMPAAAPTQRRAAPGSRGRAAPDSWRTHRARGFPLFATSQPPAASGGDFAFTGPPEAQGGPAASGAASGAFEGVARPSHGATRAERDYWAMAQGAYWRALDHFYKAENAATHSDWIARRSGWASKAPGASGIAADANKLLDEAGTLYAQGKQVRTNQRSRRRGADAAETREHKKAHELKSAERDYMAALVALDKANKAGGSMTSADEWDTAQKHWDYFYQTNRALDAKQRALDERRAQALRPFLPVGRGAEAVKVDAYVAPWTPFRACHEQRVGRASARGRRGSSRALRALKRLYARRRATRGIRTESGEGSRHSVDLQSVCYAALALASPGGGQVAFTPLATKEGHLLQKQSERIRQARKGPAAAAAGARGADNDGRGGSAGKVQRELDAAIGALNDEQARLNRARMLLYVKQFGPLKAMFSTEQAGRGEDASTRMPSSKQTLAFMGDFEQPRNEDCATPGFCVGTSTAN